jgi:hypothetical protein
MKYSTTQRITEELLQCTNISKEYIIKQHIVKLINDTPLEKLQEIFKIEWLTPHICREQYLAKLANQDIDWNWWLIKYEELQNTHTQELTITLK